MQSIIIVVKGGPQHKQGDGQKLSMGPILQDYSMCIEVCVCGGGGVAHIMYTVSMYMFVVTRLCVYT